MAGEDRYHPWRDLGNRKHITLEWAWLPRSMGYGAIRRDPDWGIVVTISNAAETIAQRRCALTHELIHDHRNIYGPEVPALIMQKEEATVRRLTAQTLVPPAELLDFCRARATVGEVHAYDICEEFDVTTDVALEAMRAVI